MYVITYGCAEWNDREEIEDREAALSRFDALREEPPTMGLYTATYITLRDAQWNTIDAWGRDFF